MWDEKRLPSQMKERGGGMGNEREGAGQKPVSAVPYDPKHREDESDPLCRVFSEALDEPEKINYPLTRG